MLYGWNLFKYYRIMREYKKIVDTFFEVFSIEKAC